MNAASEENSSHWLSYELHDGLLQWLISARMGVEAALTDVRPDQGALAARLQNSLAFLENALEEGRELIGFLENPESESDVTFGNHLALFLERVEIEAAAQGQRIVYAEPDRPWVNLPPHTAWNLLRIVQQAVCNAMRHAGECTIEVDCGWKSQHALWLTVRDNGRGFQPDQIPSVPQHYGLASMEHRAKLIGAEFAVKSEVDAGTSIQLSVPFTED